ASLALARISFLSLHDALPISSVFAEHPEATDLRWRIEHAQHVDPADVPRFAELGLIASMQAVHGTSDWPWVPTRLGRERAERTRSEEHTSELQSRENLVCRLL